MKKKNPIHGIRLYDMTRTNLLHSYWRIASFLLLALVCCGQVYQSVHLHHFHENDANKFELISQPQDLAAGDASAHHHHEEQSSSEDEHEHEYSNKVDWNVARSTSITKITFDAQALLSPAYSLPPVDFVKSTPWFQIPYCKKEQYVSFLVIRGPPHFA